MADMPLDRYPVDPQDPNAWQAEWRREVERRLSELEAARPLGSTTLTNGSLRVVDSDGFLRMVLGLQDDGSFDLAMFDPADTGKAVLLSSLAFGMRVGTAPFVNVVIGGTGGNYEVLPDTAQVTVTVGASGRLLLLGSAIVGPDAARPWLAFLAAVEGVAGGFTSLFGETGSMLTGTTGDQTQRTIMGADVLEGLTPGPHTFWMVYSAGGWGGVTLSYQSPTLIAWPL